MRFSVELPQEVIPDNHFVSLLFQNLDIYVNHELITSKSSDNDYPVSNFVFLRDGFNESLLESTGACEGYFESLNRDQSDYISDNGKLLAGGRVHLEKKRESAVEETRTGVKYFKYMFSMPLNHGLAKQDKPLPAGKIH